MTMKITDANKLYIGFAVPIEHVTDRLGKYVRYATDNKRRFRQVAEKDWRDRLRVGDVIIVSGTERIVRFALYQRSGFLRSVTCSILHCSWTGRATTILSRSDLKTRDAAPTNIKIPLRSKIDKKFEMSMRQKCTEIPLLTCCDVSGIR